MDDPGKPGVSTPALLSHSDPGKPGVSTPALLSHSDLSSCLPSFMAVAMHMGNV